MIGSPLVGPKRAGYGLESPKQRGKTVDDMGNTCYTKARET